MLNGLPRGLNLGYMDWPDAQPSLDLVSPGAGAADGRSLLSSSLLRRSSCQPLYDLPMPGWGEIRSTDLVDLLWSDWDKATTSSSRNLEMKFWKKIEPFLAPPDPGYFHNLFLRCCSSSTWKTKKQNFKFSNFLHVLVINITTDLYSLVHPLIFWHSSSPNTTWF